MKATTTIIVFLISFCLNAQWNKVDFTPTSRIYYETEAINKQGEDTVFCMRKGGGAGGFKGIFYSVDGGKNFTHFYDLYEVWGWPQYAKFIDKDTLLIVTTYGIIKRSTNLQDLPAYVIEYSEYDSNITSFGALAHFWDNNNGLVVSKSTFRTYDGGRNWTQVQLYKNNSPATIRGLVYISSTKRFICGRGTHLLETNDFGRTWDTLRISKEISSGLTFITNISFPTDSIGYATAGATLYKTTDRGETWDTLISGNVKYLSMVFADTENGFILFDNRNIIFKYNEFETQKWKEDYMLSSNTQAYDKFFYLGDSTFFLNFNDELYLRSKLALNVEQQAQEENMPIQIYPNPFGQELTVKIPQGMRDGTVEISLYNLIGELVQTHQIIGETSVTMNTSELPMGFYIAKFRAIGEPPCTQKLIKQ